MQSGTPLTISRECMKISHQEQSDYQMNRTKGFVNLNRFKSGRTLKRLSKANYSRCKPVGRQKGQFKIERG